MHITEQSSYSVAWMKTIVQKPTSNYNNTKIQNTGIISTYYEHKSFKHVDLNAIKDMLKMSKSEEKKLKIL